MLILYYIPHCLAASRSTRFLASARDVLVTEWVRPLDASHEMSLRTTSDRVFLQSEPAWRHPWSVIANQRLAIPSLPLYPTGDQSAPYVRALRSDNAMLSVLWSACVCVIWRR